MTVKLFHLASAAVLFMTVGCVETKGNSASLSTQKEDTTLAGTKTSSSPTMSISPPSTISRLSPSLETSDNISVSLKISGVITGQKISIYKDATCSSTELISGVASGTSIDLVIPNLGDDNTYKFYAKASVAGESSLCSTTYASYTLSRTPVFTSLASSITPSVAIAGATVLISTALKSNMALTGLNISLELRDSATSATIAQKTFTAVDFEANINKVFNWNYVFPSASTKLYLTVGVFNKSWNKTYTWNNNAGLLTKITAPLPTTGLSLLGVNLSGGEFNPSKIGARLFFDYVYPNNQEIDYLASKNMKIIRVPFTIVRLQPVRSGALATAEIAAIDAVVNYAKTKNITVILDPHDYGKMIDDQGVLRVLGKDPLMPANHLADFWTKLATHYKSSTNVYFNLMNEPYAQTAQEWKDVAVVAIDAIRATGAAQKILIPGTSFTGAHSWISSGNAAAWTGFSDINFAYEVHQYLDSNHSGMNETCTVGEGSKRLVAFTNWAKTNAVKGFLGEFGWAVNHQCSIEGFDLLNYMTKNTDVWLGGTYFASGPWMADYMYTTEPKKIDSLFFDRSQFTILDLFN
jgi:endoglucanase